MTGKEFITNNPLQLLVHEKFSERMHNVLHRCHGEFKYEIHETNTVRLDENFIEFTIYSPTSEFARAYYHIGYCVALEFGATPIGIIFNTNNKAQQP